MQRPTVFVIACLLLALLAAPALAWWQPGHELATRRAAALLPDDMPAFFREGAATLAHVAVDPDLGRNPKAPQLTATIGPEHYFDAELVPGWGDDYELPATRYAFLKTLYANDLNPARVGLLPYAVAEGTQRLTIAFAEHRRWPDNPHIRMKVLVYAGLLSHYAQDLHMPLHMTIHYDGRVGADGRSPGTGIHEQIDALPGRLDAAAFHAQPTEAVEPVDDLMAAIRREIDASRSQIDRAYQLEPRYPPSADADTELPADVEAFARQRMNAAARFTAQLYLTAWRDSAETPLESYLVRE